MIPERHIGVRPYEVLAGDSEMIMLVCETIRKLFCMSDEGYEVFLMDLEEYKEDLELMKESEA